MANGFLVDESDDFPHPTLEHSFLFFNDLRNANKLNALWSAGAEEYNEPYLITNESIPSVISFYLLRHSCLVKPCGMFALSGYAAIAVFASIVKCVLRRTSHAGVWPPSTAYMIVRIVSYTCFACGSKNWI